MSFPPQPTALRRIAGVDEAGRGPLAGPVYAAAVILDPARPIDGIRDSKKLSAVQREALAAEIRCSALSWSIASADVGEIDTLNILRASHLAMRRALAGLHVLPQHVQIDGNLCPSLEGLGLTCTMEAVIRGDDSVPEIGAASILAKVARDAVMCELDGHYPQYGFALHKGYPTARHLAALGEHGASPIHRRSFGPVKAVLKQGSGGSQEVREAGMEGRGSGPASAAS